MIIANFSKGETCKGIYGGLWQWDYGQVLRIQGLELPTAVEIHFSLREKGGEAVTRVGTTKDGVTDVTIPDSMLENNGSAVDYFIYAFIYLTDETSGQTEYKISMQVKARPKPEAFDTPEDAELFREAIAAVNAAADRAESAEKEAEGWAHGREDMPEKAEDNAKYYADKAAKDAEQTSADRKEVERLVESVSGIDEDVELVRGYKEAAEKAAENAATSAQASEKSRKASETAKTAAEAAQTKAEEAASKTAEDRTAVEQAKTDVEGMKNQVAEDKTSIEQTVSDFGLTAQQAVTAVNNAGQTQTERVQGAGNTAVQDIQTAKEQAIQSVETAGTEQVQAVQTEGTTQIGAVQQKGQEVLDSIPEDFTTQMSAKLDKNQGAENSGKVLVVGKDGTIAPGETPVKVDSTLTKSGQAADAKATGDKITALAIKNQISGVVPIIITDSAEYPIQDLCMEGRTEQVSTTGAQILNIDSFFDNSSIKVLDGSIFEIENRCRSDYIYLPEGEYTISREKTGAYWKMCRYDSDKVFKETIFDQIAISVISFSVNKNEYIIIAVDKGKESIKKEGKIMLNTGSSALPWEPYTGGQPSPSPDYPQEIVNAGSWNEGSQKWEYDISIKNGLLDDSLWSAENWQAYGENPFAGYKSFLVQAKPNATYTVSRKDDKGMGLGIYLCINTDQRTANSGTFLINSITEVRNKQSVQVSTDDTGIILITSSNYNNLSKVKEVAGYIQIDEGTEALPYREPKVQAVTLTSDRPLTKWDRLEKRDEQWGWVFKSNIQKILEHASLGSTEVFVNFPNNTLPDAKGGYIISNYFTQMQGNSSYNFAFLTNEYVIKEFGSVQSLNDFIDLANSTGNPVYVVYETKSETFVPLTEPEQTALNTMYTNYPTTVLVNDQGCEMSLEYVVDTKNYIDQKIQESIQQSIAGNLLSTNSNQSLSAPMGAALNLRLEALEAKAE